MKQFKENFKPIEIELVDIDGNAHELKTVFLPSEKVKEIEQITDAYIAAEKGHTEFIHKTMSIRFGKKETFWGKFSNDLLKDVVLYLKEEQEKKN